MLKFDPIDSFHSVGSTLIGRLFLFYSAGMAGLALGWLAQGFEDWRDFLHPMDVLENLMSGGLGETVMLLLLWPLVSLGAFASPWFFLIFALTMGVVFLIMVYTEEPAPLWWLGMVAVTSLVPAMGRVSGNGWGASSWLVLGVFWIGIGSAAFYVWRADYPAGKELIERLTGEEEIEMEEGRGD